jgi:hypothetical protein
MPSPGDRVVFEGVKIGGGRREGELVSMAGRGVTVRWTDGTQSFLIPGPGAMRIVTEAKPSGVSKQAGAARAAGNKAGRGKTAGAKKRQVAVDRAVAKTVTKVSTKKKTLSTPTTKTASKKKR